MLVDTIAFYKLLREGYSDQIFGALFDWQGKLLEGDDRIAMKIYKGAGEDAVYRWYHVVPMPGFQFLRFPSSSTAVIEVFSTHPEGKHKDSNYFRYVAITDCFRGGALPNVKVDFFVFAYKVKDLLLGTPHRLSEPK